MHNGYIYSWNVGVNNLTRPGTRHPGEDYRCHCVAELVTPEEVARLGVNPDSPRQPQTTGGLVENYEGGEKARFEKGVGVEGQEFGAVRLSKEELKELEILKTSIDTKDRRKTIEWISKNIKTPIDELNSSLIRDSKYVLSIITALYEIESEFGRIPARIRFQSNLKGNYSLYKSETNTIYIPAVNYGILEAIERDNKIYKLYKDSLAEKFHIIENFKDLLLHELGHVLDIKSKLYYTDLIKRLKPKELESLLKISGNSKEEAERFADAFVAIVQNKKEAKYVPEKLKKEILKIIKRGK